jgi:hypothetical protein
LKPVLLERFDFDDDDARFAGLRARDELLGSVPIAFEAEYLYLGVGDGGVGVADDCEYQSRPLLCRRLAGRGQQPKKNKKCDRARHGSICVAVSVPVDDMRVSARAGKSKDSPLRPIGYARPESRIDTQNA